MSQWAAEWTDGYVCWKLIRLRAIPPPVTFLLHILVEKNYWYASRTSCYILVKFVLKNLPKHLNSFVDFIRIAPLMQHSLCLKLQVEVRNWHSVSLWFLSSELENGKWLPTYRKLWLMNSIKLTWKGIFGILPFQVIH